MKKWIVLTSLFVLLILQGHGAQGLVYDKCPDSAQICGNRCYYQVTWALCRKNDITIRDDRRLENSWNSDDVPFNGSEFNNGLVLVNSAKINITLEPRSKDTWVRVSVTDCQGEGLHDYPRFNLDNKINKQYDITEYFMDCIDTDSYIVVISPQDEDIRVSMVNLTVDYKLIGKLSVFLETDLYPSNTIGKLDNEGHNNSFTVSSLIECEGGQCGDVKVVLQYKEVSAEGLIAAEENGFKKVPKGPTKEDPFYVQTDNPYPCGELNHGETCDFEWTVYTTKTGNYLLRAVAGSSNIYVRSVVSERVPVKVRTGELSVEGVYFDPNTIVIGDNTTLHATVSCSDYNCGEVYVYAKNGISKIVPLPNEDDNFILYDNNPQESIFIAGDSKTVSWILEPKMPGEYTEIHVAADPLDSEMDSIDGFPAQNLQVNEPSPPDTGWLSISETTLVPLVITEGESTALSGSITCNDDPCGSVTAYARHNSENIPETGPLTTTNNPQQPDACWDMQRGDTCGVSWEISGNDPGTYSSINILASSDNPEVSETTSGYLTLEVKKSLGDILVSASLHPLVINISEYTELSGEVSCSSDYCGELTVAARYESTTINSTGDISTDSDNPIICETPPCDFKWNITGNANKTYEIEITAESNESISNQTSIFLTVNDPENPQPTSLRFTDTKDVDGIINSPFIINASVHCTSGDCGQASVYLQYLDENQVWQTLTEETVLHTDENAQTVVLNSGQSESLTWSVTSSENGTFSMKIIADAVSGDVIDGVSEFSADIASPGIIHISIISPEDSQVFSRGDKVPLSIKVTESGLAKTGLSPKAEFSNSLFSETKLVHQGSGIYSNDTEHILPTADGEYTITYEAEGTTKSVNIRVDPSLDVTLNTDKYSYTTDENPLISGRVLKKNNPVKADVSIHVSCTGLKPTTWNTRTSSKGYYSLTPGLIGLIGICSLEASATEIDKGNFGSARTEINISKSPLDVYSVFFINPESGRDFNVGDQFNITVEVLLESIYLNIADVTCTDIYGNENIFLNRSGPGLYSGMVEAVRYKGMKEWEIKCEAHTDDELFGGNRTVIGISPVFIIDPLDPKEPVVEKGETHLFRVQVSYSDFGFMEEGSVVMIIEDVEIPMNYTRNGIYETQYTVDFDGQKSILFQATDKDGNTGEYAWNVESRFYFAINWIGILLIILGAVILGSLWFVHRTRKGKTMVKTVYKTIVKGPDRRQILQNKIKDLEKERKALDKAKEDAEMGYYQRELTESEFRKMMEGYEQNLLKIEAEIQEFRKELESLKGS